MTEVESKSERQTVFSNVARTQSSHNDSGLGLDLAEVIVRLTDIYCLILHPQT